MKELIIMTAPNIQRHQTPELGKLEKEGAWKADLKLPYFPTISPEEAPTFPSRSVLFDTTPPEGTPRLANWTDTPTGDWADHRPSPKGPSKVHPLTYRPKPPAIAPKAPAGRRSLREVQDQAGEKPYLLQGDDLAWAILSMEN